MINEALFLSEEKKSKSGLALFKTWVKFLKKCLKEDINLGAVKKLLIVSIKSATLKECEKIERNMKTIKESKALDIDFKKYEEKYPKKKSELNSLKNWITGGMMTLINSEIKKKSKLKEDFDYSLVNEMADMFVKELIDETQM